MTVKLPPQSHNQSPTADLPAQQVSEWIAQKLAPRAQVQVRLRGNVLHVLCETPVPLHKGGATSRLLDALIAAEKTDNNIVTAAFPQIYQLYLYGRRQGQTKPDWTAPIYLNRLERHKAQLQQQSAASLRLAEVHSPPSTETMVETAAIAEAGYTDQSTAALVLSQMSLARQGQPDAIAWYLSEVLSTLDVGVWVSIRAVPGSISPSASADERTAATAATSPGGSRLWVLCEATYSPDPLLIAEPVAERLRRLALRQFDDAVVVIQVQGEHQPDWSLRVDLTSPEEMLRDWGRWGDPAAILRLLNQSLSDLGLEATIEHQDTSLHVTVQPATSEQPEKTQDQAVAVPPKAPILDRVGALLEAIAPQGLQQLWVYGKANQATPTPDWVQCLPLPAAEHPELAVSPHDLARQGDVAALTYLLTRLLNPDLEAWLTTGGIRIRLLQKDTLLHVMADAPICPPRRQVVPPVLEFLETLALPALEGLRVYGRRAGQQRPAWSYGQDFRDRPGLVPKAEPTFAASDAYMGDLLTATETEEVAPVSPEGVEAEPTGWHRSLGGLRAALMQTQLLVPRAPLPRSPQSAQPAPQGTLKIGLIWGAIGLLIALQADWLLGQLLKQTSTASSAGSIVTQTSGTDAPPPTTPGAADFHQELSPATEAQHPAAVDASAPLPWDESVSAVSQTSFSEAAAAEFAESLAAARPYSSFRSQQLDKKLSLYHQQLTIAGPADVLVLGSSRALRGVDPAVLHRELSALGFGDLRIFNFGINGATAQVVELTLRRILETEQLPRLILWADGARAFNSGRTDVTYNAIATSQGYQELGQRRPDTAEFTNPELTAADGAAATSASIGAALRDSYQALDQTLSKSLGQWSAVYDDREELKTLLQEQVMAHLVAPVTFPVAQKQTTQNTSDLPVPEGSRIDRDGFLALDMRFNPATYYQQYARVPGRYDSDYEEFELQGIQVEALQRLLRHTQELQIPIVFINTPLTDEYLDDYRVQAEAAFRRMMLEFSVTEDLFVFRDLGELWQSRYDYFSDPSHLNRYGAYQLSDRIAQDPMIPWPEASDVFISPEEPLP